MKSNKAFTLIELLVVVLIIGILAAIAVPQYQVAVLKSRFSTIKEMASSIKNAEEMFYLANGRYTSNFSDLDITLPGSIDSESENVWNLPNDEKCSISLDVMSCNIKGIISFQRYYTHANVHPNDITCISTTDNDITNKVCQAETGKDTPRWSGSGRSTYAY